MSFLAITGLGKAFGGTTVLDDVTLSVRAGSLTSILGRSGSGKTTLLRLICGFERAHSGTIAIDGRVVSGPGVEVRAERRRVGYVAQEGALFPHLRVADNVVFGLPSAERRTRSSAGAMLELVGLPASYGGRWPHELSGGEQQRVALARALAPSPGLVLLDEPFSSLDAALRAETRDAVAQALDRSGATALLVTHDQAEALSMSDEVAVLRGGRLVQVASPEMLYRRPADVAVARFVGEAVVLDGLADGGAVACVLGRLTLAAELFGPAEVVLRPEQIRLVAPEEAPDRAARVDAVTFFGPDALVRLTTRDGDAVLARVAGHRAPARGEIRGLLVEGPVSAFARPGVG